MLKRVVVVVVLLLATAAMPSHSKKGEFTFAFH